jgi:hypothetical protein
LPLAEHSATGRLVYLETDPVQLQAELLRRDAEAIAFLKCHCALFTWGLNYGKPDCQVPLPDDFKYELTLPPIVPDFWQSDGGYGNSFTTIGNWRQHGAIKLNGDVYQWSKHFEFLKFIDLPARTGQLFELALGSYGDTDKQLLEGHGWKVRDALPFSLNPDDYRQYIMQSRGEFTVAKDQNVRLRSGWFSERSAQYLAAGRPVIMQQTGFSNTLPTGMGLFAFSTMDEIVEAVETINADYKRHCRAAQAISEEYFRYDIVLKPLLVAMGL